MVLFLFLLVLCQINGRSVYFQNFLSFRKSPAVKEVVDAPPKIPPAPGILGYVGLMFPFKRKSQANKVVSIKYGKASPHSTALSSSNANSSWSNATVDDLKVPQKLMVLTFVNGIYHSEKEVRELAIYLRCMFRSDVRTFYNPSSGSWVKDAYKAGFELVLRPNDLILAKQLAEHLRSALREVHPKKGHVLHIAHSGGAIITYLAAKYHLTKAESNRIDVVTLGAGRSLTHKYFKGRLYNYYARNDPVLLVESRAAQLLKKTTNHTYSLVRDSKHNTTFVFLEAVAQDTIYDHAVDGPTYRQALGWEAREFQARLRQMMQSDAREKSYVRLARKKVAKFTGVRHFWRRYTTPSVALNVVRDVRKFSANVTNIHGLFSGKPRLVNSFLSERSIVNMFGNLNVSEPAMTRVSNNNITTSHSIVENPVDPTNTTDSVVVVPSNDTVAVVVQDVQALSSIENNNFQIDNSTNATFANEST